jgi:uncharacterized protein (UPF0147 family)
MSSKELTAETIEKLEELENDVNIPKNIKIKIKGIIDVLKEEIEVSIKVNKALNELDEISNDANLEPYTRTQIWNIVSILEKVNH